MTSHVCIRGRIHLQNSSDLNSTWEIAFDRKDEYNKLSKQRFPVTVNKNRDGIIITLLYKGATCSASLHRGRDYHFHIGHDKNRAQFKNLLRNVGFTGTPMGICVTEQKNRFEIQ